MHKLTNSSDFFLASLAYDLLFFKKKRFSSIDRKIVHRLLWTGTRGDNSCCFWTARKRAVIVGLFQQCCLHLDIVLGPSPVFFHISPKWANRGPGWTLYLPEWRVALSQLSITKCDLNLIQNRFSVNISKPVLCYFCWIIDYCDEKMSFSIEEHNYNTFIF